MSKITVLSDNLVNQIAAGEVIERPASCVKELVENSLDAGANSIVVEVRDGGKSLIRVSDNGCGMDREDAEKSILRHATSKIAEESDLWKIGTFGFRGEALASIASVSHFSLKTKMSGSEKGIEIICEGGDMKTIQDCGMSDGTTIEISDLFFNTPARGNYLKQEATEVSHIIAAIQTVSLIHPDVSFTLINNGKESFKLAKVGDLSRRIADVFGQTTADAFIPLFYGGTDFKLSGFVGKPAISRSGNKHQYIFVNKRPITNHLLAYRVRDAFKSLLMERKQPVFILDIEIDPSLIDVNVHPRKLEIRFEDQRRVMSVVYESVKTALEKTNLMPKAVTEAARYMSDSFPKDYGKVREAPGGSGDMRDRSISDSFAGVDSSPGRNFSKDFDQSQRPQGSLGLEEDRSMLKAVTQVANSYIVAQSNEGLVLVDQHAAHERVRYFELMDQFDKKEKNIQPLLMPENLELNLEDLAILRNNLEVFAGLGFEIEEGPNGLVLYAVPSVLSSEDISDVVGGVLNDIDTGSTPSSKQGRTESILHYMSCRSAIKFGQKLSIDEMDALIIQLEKIDRPYTCPHGRPTMISLTFDELEKMFGRK